MESTPPPPKQGLLGWKIMSPELKGSCGENLKRSSSSKASSLSEVAPVKTSLSVVPLLINLCHPLLNMRSFVNCVVCLPYALPLLYISLFVQEQTSVKSNPGIGLCMACQRQYVRIVCLSSQPHPVAAPQTASPLHDLYCCSVIHCFSAAFGMLGFPLSWGLIETGLRIDFYWSVMDGWRRGNGKPRFIQRSEPDQRKLHVFIYLFAESPHRLIFCHREKHIKIKWYCPLNAAFQRQEICWIFQHKRSLLVFPPLVGSTCPYSFIKPKLNPHESFNDVQLILHRCAARRYHRKIHLCRHDVSPLITLCVRFCVCVRGHKAVRWVCFVYVYVLVSHIVWPQHGYHENSMTGDITAAVWHHC